jgi:hypothetical protein
MSPNSAEEAPKTYSGSVRLDHKAITATEMQRTRFLAVVIAGTVLVLMTVAYIYLLVTKSESASLWDSLERLLVF